MNRQIQPQAVRRLSPEDLFAQARDLCSAGRFAEAEPIVRRLLSSAAKDGAVLNLASVVAYGTGQVEQAVRYADRAISVAPDSALPPANRARALTELGRLDEAIYAYERALRLNPGINDIRNGLAFALRCASRLEEAEQQARAAVQHAPGDETLYTNLGCILCDLGRPREAVSYFDQSLQLRPRNPAARHNRGMALLLDGAFDQGWRDYEARWQVPPLVPRGFRQPQWGGGERTPRRTHAACAPRAGFW